MDPGVLENLRSQVGGILFEDNQEAEAGVEEGGEEEGVAVATMEAILILDHT